jgi:hypothetical protein
MHVVSRHSLLSHWNGLTSHSQAAVSHFLTFATIPSQHISLVSLLSIYLTQHYDEFLLFLIIADLWYPPIVSAKRIKPRA